MQKISHPAAFANPELENAEDRIDWAWGLGSAPTYDFICIFMANTLAIINPGRDRKSHPCVLLGKKRGDSGGSHLKEEFHRGNINNTCNSVRRRYDCNMMRQRCCRRTMSLNQFSMSSYRFPWPARVNLCTKYLQPPQYLNDRQRRQKRLKSLKERK